LQAPLRRLDVEERRAPLDSCVVHEDVEPSHVCGDRAHDGSHAVNVTDVGLVDSGAASRRSNLLAGRSGGLCIRVDDGDVCSG